MERIIDVINHIIINTYLYIVLFNEISIYPILLWLVVDLDYFIGKHRVTFHNVFYLFFISMVFSIIYSKTLLYTPKFFAILLSHIIFDFLFGGVCFLYKLCAKGGIKYDYLSLEIISLAINLFILSMVLSFYIDKLF
ncbi:NEQ197 [Nanoarchaeum equitans Kin4-M]|uniref:NEQ197 n=1 Tax=Nanoarchaeum equitans (strain Kin4-M) TaxID=228908 RepID=Q74MQ1_NANEQ|nr:NEQ197 [Nanoarchaeum equitans Kin4-M]